MRASRIHSLPKRPSSCKKYTHNRLQPFRFASQIAKNENFGQDLDDPRDDAVTQALDPRRRHDGPTIRKIWASPLPTLPYTHEYNPLSGPRPPASTTMVDSGVAPITDHPAKFLVKPDVERFPDVDKAHRSGFISSKKDYEAVKDALPVLVGQGPWQLSKIKPHRLYRTFRFKTFRTTWQFMKIIADECAIQRHHPEWANMYNRVRINWVTHDPPGLSSKDIAMAEFCDERAKELGELPHENDVYADTRLGNLTDNEISRKNNLLHHMKTVLQERKVDADKVRSLLSKWENAE